MSDCRVLISKKAWNEIESTYRYISDELHNPTAAKTYLKETMKAVDSLESFPLAHMVRPNARLVDGREMRQFFYRRNYGLFYVVNEEQKTVKIVHALSPRLDLDRIL